MPDSWSGDTKKHKITKIKEKTNKNLKPTKKSKFGGR